MEYTSAFLNTFKWAKDAYAHLLDNNTSETMTTNVSDLSVPILGQLNSYPEEISSSSEWNTFAKGAVSDLAGVYSTINKTDDFMNTLRQKFAARLSQGERKLREMETIVRNVRSSSNLLPSTVISVAGGDSSWVDTNPSFYTDTHLLSFSLLENAYTLPPVQTFSTIRTNGYLGGKVFVEKTLTPMLSNGKLANVVDGSLDTSWVGTSYQPSIVKTSLDDIPWLSTSYVHGAAILLTYALERPTIAGEVFISPVSTEPFTLLSVSWTPPAIKTAIADANFTTSTGWSYLGTTGKLASGLGGLPCSFVRSTTGSVQYTFGVSSALTTSLSGVITSWNTANQRFEFLVDGRTDGDCKSTLKVTWLDSSGDVLTWDQINPNLSSFYREQRLVTYSPTSAASGVIDLSINTLSVPSTSYFRNARLYAGEDRWVCDELIETTKVIPLPTAVSSSRFSFCLAQTSVRVETRTNENTPIEEVYTPQQYIDPSINSLMAQIYSKQNNRVASNSFVYRIGVREIDLRYSEYLPKASLTTTPLGSLEEVRQLWVEANLDKYYSDNVGFFILPFAGDTSVTYPVRPFLSTFSGRTLVSQTQGDILSIYTSEEEEAGWASRSPLRLITEPVRKRESFNGTDRDGVIQLNHAPHFRRVTQQNINSWLEDHSVWPAYFDPNNERLLGLADQALATRVRNGNTAFLELSDFVSSQGYLPIKVTVTTDRWTAEQDSLGKSTTTLVRKVENEVLTKATIVETKTQVNAEYITFDQYLLVTNYGEFMRAKFPDRFKGNILGLFGKPDTSYFDNNIRIAFDAKGITNGHPDYKAAEAEYKFLLANRRLPKVSDVTTTLNVEKTSSASYQTKFKPILKTGGGALFNLYWYNSTTGEKIGVAPSDYTLDSSTGVVTTKAPMPASSDSIAADYTFVSNKFEETGFDFLRAQELLLPGESQFTNVVRNFPITRNVTDYATGVTPTIRRPNFNQLDPNYYPIVEYYVTSGGKIVLSDEFFTYGDNPAAITVEYESLDVAPRLTMLAARSGGATVSPRIYGASLKTREISGFGQN
jgi:hypothetical protein